jgi:hypothetical protein
MNHQLLDLIRKRPAPAAPTERRPPSERGQGIYRCAGFRVGPLSGVRARRARKGQSIPPVDFDCARLEGAAPSAPVARGGTFPVQSSFTYRGQLSGRGCTTCVPAAPTERRPPSERDWGFQGGRGGLVGSFLRGGFGWSRRGLGEATSNGRSRGRDRDRVRSIERVFPFAVFPS